MASSNLSKDLPLILDNTDDYDVIIQVGENQNTKEYHAHSAILRASSPYFKSAFSSNWTTKKDNMIMFSKPNVSPTVFDMILKYIYTGELDLTKQSGEVILELLVASDELLLEGLIDCCVESICENPQSFITSKTFLSLDKDILFNLLKRDELQIEEIAVWECLIKWGIEQTPNLGNKNNDRTKWNNEDYKALKKTLNQFIPLIRFVGITHKDFFDKVYPYMSVISNNIYKEIVGFYNKGILPSLPHRIGKIIDSKIIKPKLANIIVNWIYKQDATYYRTGNDTFYKFKLIYRGSRDGINNNSFKNKCNGRLASLVLIKVLWSNKIFGGYSPIGFNSFGKNCSLVSLDHNSSDSFIFSFESNEDVQNMRIGRNFNAVLDDNGHGFNFGQGSLYMVNQQVHVNHPYPGNHEKIVDPKCTVYIIEEMETFIVTN